MKITLEIPDELAEQVAQVEDRLSELVAQAIRQPEVPGHIYRHILEFLASNPTYEQVVAFRPDPAMQERLKVLLERSRNGELSSKDVQELQEYERIEHLMVMLKAGSLRFLQSAA